jgi:hypothetical protein
MKRRIMCILLFVFPILCNVAQSIEELEYEYDLLVRDLIWFGAFPSLPYYTNGSRYMNTSYMIIDVDDPMSFAILQPGYMKFQNPDGEIYYCRNIILAKKEDGLYRGIDKCLSILTPTPDDYMISKKNCCGKCLILH